MWAAADDADAVGPLERRAPTDLTAGLVLSRIDAVREVAITRGQITIGSSLVAVGAPLTARLLAVCERLLVIEPPRRGCCCHAVA